jgi:nucleoside-diphosphate-sugar epimerase
MFNNANKTLLITGGAGFIGSNFVTYFLDKYKNYNLVNLDLLTYAGDLDNLKEVEVDPRYKFIKGNICNRELVEFIFIEYDIQGVIHFAAESHVDNSIKNPGVFVETNVNGTYTLVDVAKKYWMEKPFTYKAEYQDCRFHHISTDEVYGTLSDNPNDLFTEKTPYAPNSPYSASKASSDMIIRSYVETFGLNCVITNCSNNYGPKQQEEKHFWFLARKEFILQNAINHIQPNDKIIEIGAGTGNVARYLQKNGYENISVGEMHLNGLKYAQSYGMKECYQFDLLDTPFENEFDTVCMFDVLEHIPDDKLALENVNKMLNGGG